MEYSNITLAHQGSAIYSKDFCLLYFHIHIHLSSPPLPLFFSETIIVQRSIPSSLPLFPFSHIILFGVLSISHIWVGIYTPQTLHVVFSPVAYVWRLADCIGSICLLLLLFPISIAMIWSNSLTRRWRTFGLRHGWHFEISLENMSYEY